MPGRIAESASTLFGRNLLNFIIPMVDKENGGLKFDWGDETVVGTLVTKDGKVVNERVRALAEHNGKKLVKKKGT